MADTTEFRRAIKAGDVERVKRMLKSHFNPNTRYSHEWTALHFAAKDGNNQIAELLLDGGAEVNALSALWETALDQARRHDHAAVAKLIERRCAKPGFQVSLHAAVYAGDLKWVKKHLDSGADINLRCKGQLPLCIALERRHWSIGRYLLKSGADVKRAQSDGDTALHCAARYADEALIKALIRAGADVNAPGAWNWRPLSVAAAVGNIEIVQLLMAQGAKVNADAAGSAIDAGYDDLARFLIEQGARVSLRQAVECGDVGLVRRMIHEGVDLNEGDKHSSHSPVATAIEKDRPDIVQMLLEAGADPNVQTSVLEGKNYLLGGDTPLHEAVYRASAKFVKLLLTYGADPDIQNARSESALELAKRREKTHLVQLMEKHLENRIAKDAVQKLFTIAKVAELLSVDESFVTDLIKRGKLVQLKLDAVTIRVPESSLAKYLGSLRP
jgi:ankyrin repeat protein